MTQEKLKIKRNGIYTYVVNSKGTRLATHSSDNGKMCGATNYFEFLEKHLPLKRYKVLIFSTADEFEVEDKDKLGAECKAMDRYNGGLWQDVYRVETTQIPRSRD